MNTYDTNTYEHAGHTITVEWHYDNDSEAPWECCDGHGPVTEWVMRDKRPGERELCSGRNSKRFYDYAEAIKLAKRDGWDAQPYKTGTKGEQAVRAVEADFQFLKRWCDNDWYWCGYVVTIDGFDYEESLWSIDSDSQAEFEKEAVETATKWLDKELANAQDCACRDIATSNH